MEDEDRDAVSLFSRMPPMNPKSHSLSTQIRHGSTSNFNPIAYPYGSKRASQLRNHSLDEVRITNAITNHHYQQQRHLGGPFFNNDSDDEEFFPYSTTSSSSSGHNIRYDHSMSLPVIMPEEEDQRLPLPEFTASGGVGIFKTPSRSAVHPKRPPALELRPHPLRETQVRSFLRTIACTHTQLWAGQENGVRFWKFQDAYEAGVGFGGKGKRGDEDAAPFYESSVTSTTMCLVVDHGNRLVWTGHKDGKIRSWKMDQDVRSDHEGHQPFKEGLAWQAHKGPVLALIMSSYGDLWSGAEGGVIKIWPWDSIEKSLSLTAEEKHMAALLVERSSVDLRSQVTVNGVCNISSADIKIMLSDYTRGRVWCATNLSFSLWDARTRELIKVFNIDGVTENRAEIPVQQDYQPVEDELKTKFVSHSKKEKPQGFIARTRNTLLGAAEAVKRVATRGTGAFNEDNKKTEALIWTSDGTIWSACANGVIFQWDSNGNRHNDFNHHNNSAALCFCTHGSRLWVGYASGVVQLLDLDGNLLAGWVAHSSPVIKMAVGGGHVFSMAIHGGIRGWDLTSPGKIDSIVCSALSSKELLYTRKESIKMLVGTWNVGQGKPNPEALRSWLGSVVTDVGIVVVGLQEVEMGAGFLAVSAAKETVGLEGSAIGQNWQDSIGRVLDEGIVFERVGSRQLAGLLIAIWVRKNLRMHAGDLDVAAVACGFGRTIGNKGGVGLRLRVHDRIICFVNCHLAAHLEAVNRRNADFDHIFRSMVFSRQSHLLNVAAVGASSASQVARTANNGGSEKSDDSSRSDLSEADMVVFLGDFNYRLFGISYDEARDFVSQRSFDWLKEKDQLRAEMKAGKVFQGMREAVVKFPPTYKFERHVPGLGGYDSGEKKRIPAWCDRVIYRDCRNRPVSECSLSCPILGSIQMYEACMDVTESDHKPVRCKFSVHLARVDRSVRRKEFGEAIKNSKEVKFLLKELSDIPKTAVSTASIILQNQEASVLQITNKNKDIEAVFRIICEGQCTINANGQPTELRPRASFGFPSWLEVTPASGVIDTEQSMDVIIRHTESNTGDLVDGVPQNWWTEDTRDKEAVLAIQVGRSSLMALRTHRVRVRHCYTQRTFCSDSRSNGSRRGYIGFNYRSESQRRDNSHDSVDR